MKISSFHPKIINTIPVFISVLIAAVLVWYFHAPALSMPLVLGIIAGGLVDLDNRLTGRLKNMLFTLCAFAFASVGSQIMLGKGMWFVLWMTAITFGFTWLGAIGLRYRTIAFGTLAVATYTTLTHKPDGMWLVNPLMILLGTSLYGGVTLLSHMIFPHRTVQQTVGRAYAALGAYFDAKSAFFDPDEADLLDSRQVELAMKNARVIAAFNECRSALFYRMRGQNRHPRTVRMLRFYFTAQDIHERISSAHFEYRALAEKLKNTDLIFRIQRLLELQAQACRDIAESLRSNEPYAYSSRLTRAIEGSRQSLNHYADTHDGMDVHALQRLLDNLRSIDYQLAHLNTRDATDLETDSDASRIAALEQTGLKHAWRTMRSQMTFESVVFRHAVRLAIVVFTACMTVEVLDLKLGYWILLTALFVCQPNYSSTKSRVNQRIIGTILGVLVSALIPYFTPSIETKLWIVVAATTLFFFFRSNDYRFSTFFITIQAMTSFSLAGLDMYAAMPLRIVDTLIGSAIAWVAVSYLWPDWRYLTLDHTARRAITYNGTYLRVILDQLQHGGMDDIGYRSVRRQAHERAVALSNTLSNMSSEPEKYGDHLQNGFNLLRLNYNLIGYISALGAYRQHLQPQSELDDTDFTEPFYRMAYRVADVLDAIASLEPSAFDAIHRGLSAELAAMRPASDTTDRQRVILWQQLSMIVRQLPACFRALRNEQEAVV